MKSDRFDVIVIGAGPAGSFAALTLARGGARVALLDKAVFPRDKACGDLVGPRGLQLLSDAQLSPPEGLSVGDMLVIGPTDRRVRLPSAAGQSYPGHGISVSRSVFDAFLQRAALDAGAVSITGRAETPLEDSGRLDGYRTSNGEELRGDFVIGADGATSHVASTAGLVDTEKVLWGFAVRAYLDQSVNLPVIVLFESRHWRAFPGYGWIFPTVDGGANIGLGIATRADRTAGAGAVQMFPAFLAHLRAIGLIDPGTPEPTRRLGGWLKMGMIGTTPGRDRTLLVGDAAGLVNPLQGEGIAHAMTSGRDAAAAILHAPGDPVGQYRAMLARTHLPYARIAAAAHAALVGRPIAVAALGRALTLPGIESAFAGGWAIFWNELLDGAPRDWSRTVAATSTGVGRLLTARSSTNRWFSEVLSTNQAIIPSSSQ
ncbi:MAG TPA: geranylgeranyl reductase family protein [Acidimicrobiales bacterium]|nr:geranylgeranyl reductase family protein [Acidimicrobiales bacterium]